MYIYGMKLRGFSPGCQPKEGMIGFRADRSGKYYDIIYYDRKLSSAEEEYYDLEYIGADNDRD